MINISSCRILGYVLPIQCRGFGRRHSSRSLSTELVPGRFSGTSGGLYADCSENRGHSISPKVHTLGKLFAALEEGGVAFSWGNESGVNFVMTVRLQR